MSNQFWQDRPTLVTGATGLLGSWLVRRLVGLKADVVCLVRDWAPQSDVVRTGQLEKLKCVRGDVRDQHLMERVLGEYEIDTVFHLAAQTVVGIANRNPVSTFETNVAGTWSLLEGCRRSPLVGQVIMASSDKAYGAQPRLPYDEAMPLAGRHPYDVSKSAADLIAQSFATTYGLPVAITRCGNFYGGGDLNWSRIVPGTIRSVFRGNRPVIRSDGTLVRDYLYVEDGAAAYTFLAERLSADRSLTGEAFNFSVEAPLTVLELTRAILRLMGSALDPEIRSDSNGEILHQRLNAEKARVKLGWSARYSMEEGLQRTIEWYKGFLT